MARDTLGPLQYDILRAVRKLGEQRAYGVEIIDHLAETYKRKVSDGSIYTTLARLEEKGYLTSWFGEPSDVRGGRRKRFYAVTGTGQEKLNIAMEREANKGDALAGALCPAGTRGDA